METETKRMETLERLEFDADLARLLGCWSSHAKEEEKSYLVDELSHLVIEELDLESAERKLHSVLLFAALRGLGEMKEEEEAYFECCHSLLLGSCPWWLYLEVVHTCRWGRLLLQALSLLPHQRAVEVLKHTLAVDSCYFDHIVLEACLTRLCTASKKEQLEDYQKLLRLVPAARLEIFLHGLITITSCLLTSQQDPYTEGCVDLWLGLLQKPPPSTPRTLSRLQLSDSIHHRMPLFSGFLQRFSSWLDANNLELDQSELDLTQLCQLPPEDLEHTKTLALRAFCAMGVLTSICYNFDIPLDQSYMQAHAYLDLFQPDLPRLMEACMDPSSPVWLELLHFCLMHEEALTNKRLVQLMVDHVTSLDWSHLHQIFQWLLHQRHLNHLKELFIRLCQKFPSDYQNELLHQVLHRVGLNTGLCLPNFRQDLTLCLNKQSMKGEDGVVSLFLQSPLQALEAILSQVLSRPGQVPQLAKILDLVPSLCKFTMGGDCGLLLAQLQTLAQTTELTEQQELNLLSFVTLLLQSEVLSISELDVVRTLVLPSLHLRANFRLASLLLKAVTIDQKQPAWLQAIEGTELSLPALLLCTCSIATHCRETGDIGRAKDLLEIVRILASFLSWQLKGNEKVKAWLRLRTRELNPTIWPYLDSVCPLSTEECSRLDVGLLTPKCAHLAPLLQRVPPSQAYIQVVAVLSKLLPQCSLKEWEVMGQHFQELLGAGVVAPSPSSTTPQEESQLEFFHAVADALLLAQHVGPALTTLGTWLQAKKLVCAELAAPLTQRMLQLSLATSHQGVSVLLLELAALDPL